VLCWGAAVVGALFGAVIGIWVTRGSDAAFRFLGGERMPPRGTWDVFGLAVGMAGTVPLAVTFVVNCCRRSGLLSSAEAAYLWRPDRKKWRSLVDGLRNGRG
jgi:hypothetical protein